MTAAQLRAASPETLSALAPELATLVADMADVLAKTIYNTPGWTGPDVWWADDTRELLDRLDRLAAPTSRQEHT